MKLFIKINHRKTLIFSYLFGSSIKRPYYLETESLNIDEQSAMSIQIKNQYICIVYNKEMKEPDHK